MQEFDDILFTSPTSYKSQGMITQWFFSETIILFGPSHSLFLSTYLSLFLISAFNMNVVEMFQSYFSFLFVQCWFFFNRSYTISYSADITILSSANCLDFCIRKILISERTMRRPLCTVMRDRRWSWPIVVWKEHTHTIYLHT